LNREISEEQDVERKEWLSERLRFATFGLLMEKRKYFEKTRLELAGEGYTIPASGEMISIPEFKGLDRAAVVRIRDDFLSYYGLGLYYAKKGEQTEAIKAFKKIEGLTAKLKESVEWRRAPESIRSNMTAEEQLTGGKRLNFDHENPHVTRRMAAVYLNRGEWDSALDYYIRALNLEIAQRGNWVLNPALSDIGKDMASLVNTHAVPVDLITNSINKSISIPWGNSARDTAIAHMYWFAGLKELCLYQLTYLTEIRKDNPDCFVLLGDKLLEESQNEKATEIYLNAIKLDPEGVGPGILRALIAVGNYYVEKGELEKGTEHLTQALNRNPNSSWIVERVNNGFKYRDIYAAVRSKFPETEGKQTIEFMVDLSIRLSKNELHVKAIKILNDLADAEPDNLEIRKLLADIYHRAGNPGKSANVYFGISEHLREQGKKTEALTILIKALIKDMNHSPDNCANSRLPKYADRLILLTNNDSKNIIEKYLYPDEMGKNPACKILEGYVAGKSEKQEQAEKLFLEALELVDKTNGTAHHVLGKFYKDMGQDNEAVKMFKESLKREGEKVEPHNISSRIWLGDLLLKQGDVDQAIEHFRWARINRPGLGWARRALANALLEKRDHNAAITELEQFFKQNSDEKEGHFILGRAYFHVGRIEDAQSEFETCVAYFPDHGYAHRNLMLIYDMLGDKQRCEREKEIVKKLGISLQ